jgi:hypothetical protein
MLIRNLFDIVYLEICKIYIVWCKFIFVCLKAIALISFLPDLETCDNFKIYN